MFLNFGAFPVDCGLDLLLSYPANFFWRSRIYKGKPSKVKSILQMSVITIRIPGTILLGGSPSAIKKLIWAGAQACQDCLCCCRGREAGSHLLCGYGNIQIFEVEGESAYCLNSPQGVCNQRPHLQKCFKAKDGSDCE